MKLPLAIGYNDYLLGHIDQVDEVLVDDETLSDADERGLLFTILFTDHIFQLTELIGNQMVVAILREDFGVVAFGRDKHQPVGGNPQKQSGGRYDDELGHNGAKIRFSNSKNKPFQGVFPGIV